MGLHPEAAAWESTGGDSKIVPQNLTQAQCDYINANVGVSRRTLRDVADMFNKAFGLALAFDEFVEARTQAISEGRCKTTYFRNYFKGENSSERQLRRQKGVIVPRLTGGCQFQPCVNAPACAAPTTGRFCERHARQGYVKEVSATRGGDYIDSSLGKYG